MLKTINEQKEKLIIKLKTHIRKKAIENVKEKIAYNQKKISDYTKDEMRKFVKDEEKRVRKKYGTYSLTALLALLGINII